MRKRRDINRTPCNAALVAERAFSRRRREQFNREVDRILDLIKWNTKTVPELRITHAPKGNPAFVRLKRRIEAYVYVVERREQSVGCGFGQGLEEKAYAAQQALYDELTTLESSLTASSKVPTTE